MLSYRHAFHAGNFGDVLKHIVVTEVLEHLCRKEGAFDYIDTHAGAGRYDLTDARAQRLQEYAGGIARLAVESSQSASPSNNIAWRAWWPELNAWFAAIDVCNEGIAPTADGFWSSYPGSPALALQYLRPQDRAWLYELHPRDYETLSASMAGHRRVKVMNEDGFRGVVARVPPASRRALVLLDPSYEIKEDYELVFSSVAKAWRKFSTGTYVIWYPVVDRHRVQRLERQFLASGIRDVLQMELGVTRDEAGHGMTGVGLFVINPPYTLHERMAGLLPRLKTAMSVDDGAYSRCVELVKQ